MPQSEAEGDPSARTHTSCPSDFPKAPGGRLHLQARRRPGQSSDMRPSWGLPWVHQGAVRVLGACGRGRSPSRPLAARARPGSGWGAWRVKEEQVKQWAAETLLALEALHQQGVLCRDLNPRNLLLDQAGRRPGQGGGGIRLSSPHPQTEEERSSKSQGPLRPSASPASPRPLHTGPRRV